MYQTDYSDTLQVDEVKPAIVKVFINKMSQAFGNQIRRVLFIFFVL